MPSKRRKENGVEDVSLLHNSNQQPSPIEILTNHDRRENGIQEPEDAPIAKQESTIVALSREPSALNKHSVIVVARPEFFDKPSDEIAEPDYLPAFDDNNARARAVGAVSWIYALTLIILALVLETSSILSEEVEHVNQYDPFYMYLYIVSIAFMGYVQVYLLKMGSNNFCCACLYTYLKGESEESTTTSKAEIKHRASYSAPGESSLYLRIGMIVFGVFGITYYVVSMFECRYQPHCGIGSGFTSFLAAFFILFQMYFVFLNSKVVIHRLKHIGRLGTMHLVATNLSVWVKLFIMEDFLEATENMGEAGEEENSLEEKGEGGKKFLAGCSSLSCYYEDFKPLFTTSLIEYSLICGAVAFVLWKNVGHPVKTFAARKKFRVRVDCSSSRIGFLLGLVFFLGALASMVVFFIEVHHNANEEAMWIFHLTDTVLYAITTAVVLFALGAMRSLPYVAPGNPPLILLDDILLFIGLSGQLIFCLFTVMSMSEVSTLTSVIILDSLMRMIQVILQTFFILAAQRLRVQGPELKRRKPGRQLISFLLMVNIAFFVLNTFESQKATTNPVMLKFFGQSAWTIIVHAAVPLTIFFRFHSSVCLAEIWKVSYK